MTMPTNGLFLTEEQLLFKKVLREYCEENIAPYYRETHPYNAPGDGYDDYYHKWMKELGDMDCWRLGINPAFGGLSGDIIDRMIICEELCRVNGGIAVHAMVQPTHGEQVAMYAPEAWKSGLGEKILSGEYSVAGAFNSPEGQVNFSEQAPLAKKVEGGWLLNGNKCFSSVGPVCDVLLVLGLTEDGTTYGFVVNNETPGLTMTVHNEIGNSPTYATYKLEDVFVPDTHAGDAMIATNRKMNPFPPAAKGFGLLVAAGAIGSMDAAFEKTVEYWKKRTCDGKPLASMGECQRKLAIMKTEIEAARALTWTAARKIQAADADAIVVADAAKAYTCETARRITDECVQMWGCLGIDPDTGIIQHHLDCMGLSIGVCTPDERYSSIATNMGLPGATFQCL